MLRRSVALVILILAASVAACGEATLEEEILGDWTRTAVIEGNSRTVNLGFEADGVFIASVPGEEDELAGTYEIDGDTITLLDSDCGTEPGVYGASVDGDTLTFTLRSDNCNRALIVAGTWDRL